MARIPDNPKTWEEAYRKVHLEDAARKKEGSGWKEDPDHSGKAPGHVAASTKKKLNSTSRTPMKAELPNELEIEKLFYKIAEDTHSDVDKSSYERFKRVLYGSDGYRLHFYRSDLKMGGINDDDSNNQFLENALFSIAEHIVLPIYPRLKVGRSSGEKGYWGITIYNGD